jgi:hypothetical protein
MTLARLEALPLGGCGGATSIDALRQKRNCHVPGGMPRIAAAKVFPKNMHLIDIHDAWA